MKSNMKDMTEYFKPQLDLLYGDKLWWMLEDPASCNPKISMRMICVDEHHIGVIMFSDEYQFVRMNQNVPVFNLIEKEK